MLLLLSPGRIGNLSREAINRNSHPCFLFTNRRYKFEFIEYNISLQSHLPGPNLKMTNPENTKIDLNAFTEATLTAEQAIWEDICAAGNPSPDNTSVLYAGYY